MKWNSPLAWLSAGLSLFVIAAKAQPIRLYEQNPRYFEYRGKPLFIVSSSESYASVYNLDFDYVKHLDALKAAGLNFTKIFTGLWSTPEDSVFKVTESSFIVKPGRQVTPFYQENGRFDLNRWNPIFFDRLHRMLAEANKRDIIVEISLFSSYYNQAYWGTSVFNCMNNLNATDSLDYKRIHTLHNGNILLFQQKMVRKIVQEVNRYPNIYFEILNEPWADNPNLQAYVNMDNDSVYSDKWQKLVEVGNDATLAWQREISSTIVEEESKLANKHLIAQNFGNFAPVINLPDPNVTVYNFHYANPEAVLYNLNHKRILALDETGFMPHDDFQYRREAWQFVLAGGGMYNNLDFSFVSGFEDGSHTIVAHAPGWGGPALRSQLRFMKDIMETVPFWKMQPMPEVMGTAPKGSVRQIFGKPGEVYVCYHFEKSTSRLSLSIPEGKYTAQIFDPATGRLVHSNSLTSKAGMAHVDKPNNMDELLLVVRRQK